jgi:glycosyltransferase involved in cell wall biosynthesis
LRGVETNEINFIKSNAKNNSNMTKFTIGVIIPVFNSGREAINAIGSVIAQTNVSVQEIVVVDDGSTDDSADFLRKTCRELSISVRILSTPNGGAANARNHGMQNCNCDLYAFLDSDDTWLSNKLERQLSFFSDISVGMVGCLTSMGRAGTFSYINSSGFRIINLRQQLFKNYFQTSTVIVRRHVVQSVGPFPTDQRHAEEGDFFNRIVGCYKSILLTEFLVDYGGGKHGFGASGLSSNLIAMEKGELRNILRVFKRGDCGFGILAIAVSYSLMKFVRRVIITALRRRLSNV